jgi:hypothetical protein
MALYRCAVIKVGNASPYLGVTWRNVYTLEAASYDAALAAADVIAGHEAVFHTDKVSIPRVTAHLVTEPARRVGATLEIDRAGLYSPVGDPWPLYNTVRVDYPDVGVGRPERKYYRVGLHDGMVQADLGLLGTYQSIVNDACVGITDLANFVGPSGEGHGPPAVHHGVQMRQQGWHRRRRPGFVRGYVPV